MMFRKHIKSVIFFCLLSIISYYSSVFADEENKFFKIKEPLFTNGLDSSNVLRCNKHKLINLGHQQFYQLNYGYKLQNWGSVQLDDTTFIVKGLLRDSLFFYRVIYYEKFPPEPDLIPFDTTNVDSSFQDSRPPRLDTLKIANQTLTVGDTSYIGKITANALNCSFSDRHKFYFYHHDTSFTHWFEFDSVATSPGLSYFKITRDGDSILPWDHQNATATHPIDTTFNLNEVLPSEGEFAFALTVKDAAYNPDQSLGILGNDTTYNFSVIYDVTKPTLDFSKIDSLYTSKDTTTAGTIILPVIITDNLAGIDTSSLVFGLSGADPDRIIKGYSWSGNILNIEVEFITDTQYTLNIRITDFCGNQGDGSISFHVDQQPPILTGFTMHGLDYPVPHSSYTNSTVVILDSFQPSDLIPDALHVYGVGGGNKIIDFQNAIRFNLQDVFGTISSGQQLIIKLAARDTADNEQDYDTAPIDTINFDNIPPVLDSITVKDRSSGETTSTDEPIVNVFPSWQLDDGIVSIYIREDDSITGSIFSWLGTPDSYYKFQLTPTYGPKIIGAWLRDRAGNQSAEQTDTIVYRGSVSVHLKLQDPDTSVCESALADYLNDTSASIVIIDSSGHPDSIRFGSGTKWLTLPITATSLNLRELVPSLGDSPTDTRLLIKYFAMRNDGALQPDTPTVTLHFDNIPPLIDSLVLQDTFANPCPAQVGFTNDDSVRLYPKTTATDVCQIKTGFAAAQLGACQPWQDNMTIVLSEGEDRFNLFASIRDSAGNWSDTAQASIYKDQSPPTITIELQDNHTKDPSRTDSQLVWLHITSATDAGSGLHKMAVDTTCSEDTHYFDHCDNYKYPVADMAKNACFDPENNIYFLKAAVCDSAGNRSQIAYDDIPPGELVLQSITLFDRDDKNPDDSYRDSKYTNEDSIIIIINKEGIPTDYAANENLDSLVKNPDWQNYSSDTIKFKLSPEEGSHTVFLVLRDLTTGNVSEIKSNKITLDKTPPDSFAFHLQDTTTVDKLCSISREFIPFDPVIWTNDSLIWAIANSAHDALSGIDSMRYNQIKYKYVDNLQIEIPNTPDQFSVCGAINDLAGNWQIGSNCQSISCDFTAPRLKLRYDSFDYPEGALQFTAHFNLIADSRSLWKVIVAKDTCFNGDTLQFTFPEGTISRDSLVVPTSWHRVGMLYFIASDRAGNASQIDSVFIQPVRIIKFNITVFDYDEYLSGYIDSLYSGERQVAIEIKVREGILDSIKFWDVDSSTAKWIPKSSLFEIAPNRYQYDDFICSPTIDSAGFDTLYALVKNKLNLTSRDTSHIYYNSIPPTLTRFKITSLSGDEIGSTEKKVKIAYSAEYENSRVSAELPLAALVLSNSRSNSTQVLPISSRTGNIEYDLGDNLGEYIIYGYVLDAADYPQNLTDYIESFIHHPSNTLSDSIRFNPIETSNYPNPFNPPFEITKLLFYLGEDSPVEISIFDPFGNLVTSWKTQGKKGFNDGHSDPNLCWNGENNKGQIVANGGYICVIKPDVGSHFVRRIAVMKKGNSNDH